MKFELEWMDGSSWMRDGLDQDEIDCLWAEWIGEPVRIWVNDKQVQQGFVALDER